MSLLFDELGLHYSAVWNTDCSHNPCSQEKRSKLLTFYFDELGLHYCEVWNTGLKVQSVMGKCKET